MFIRDSGGFRSGFLVPVFFLLSLFLPSSAFTQRYRISLAHPEQHLVHVKLDLEPGPKRELQLPVWNALYQVRDFSQHLNWIRATDGHGKSLPVRLLAKSRWRVEGASEFVSVEYEIAADDPGPYGAQLNAHHAFFNLAEILMYPVDAKQPLRMEFFDVPDGWKVATSLHHGDVSGASGLPIFSANSYDELVDAPVELGAFKEADFRDGDSLYRVVVDADPADYNLEKLIPTVRKIVVAANSWMNDHPITGLNPYVFIYHFPREPGGGGMEHAYSTAIDVDARVLNDSPQSFADVTAHEFFHLWNVKRIRPQSLEPVDYTKENYTPMLWFCEGVTDTVQNYVLLRAGLLDERGYLNRLAAEIADLERRPARLAQSAEESSRDAWLEKYPSYLLPQRSISYYNKGDVLGVILDLEIRDASRDAASLRDVFQWMNQNYAKKGQPFPDEDGVLQAIQAVSYTDLRWFFNKYVAGTDEIPWNDFLRSAGLQLVRQTKETADLGFWAARNFGAAPVVAWVTAGQQADGAGLKAGDFILEINGRVTSSDFRQQLADLRPGDSISLRVRNSKGDHEVHWKLGSRESIEFEIKDLEQVTAEQRARRAAWLVGRDQIEGHP